MKICYVKKTFRGATLDVIRTAEAICQEYAAQGITITLRQLYYQFVARGYIANKDTEYKRLGSIVNDARLAGLIDWNHLQDRTRNLQRLAFWTTADDIVRDSAAQFHVDMWASEYQSYRPEVWIEKDALVGVIETVCDELDVPYFSCRGYTSQSEMWAGAMRLKNYLLHDQTPVIFHFGDHDPSGRDMSRDIRDRMEIFGVRVRQEIKRPQYYRLHYLGFERVALNMDQIEEYDPPPNPAKLTDARATAYIEEFGSNSWELDALEPTVITDLIRDRILAIRDADGWQRAQDEENRHKAVLTQVAEQWDRVVELLEDAE